MLRKVLFLIMSANLIAMPKFEPPPVAIEITKVKPVENKQRFTYLGTVKAAKSATLSLARPGLLSKIFVQDNSFVKQGQPILQTKPDMIQAQLIAANAKLKLAYLNQDRVTKLYRDKAIAKERYDQASSELAIAKSNYLSLKEQLSDTILTAPFAGNIGYITADLGEYIKAGMPITKINDLSSFKVEFYLPQEQVIDANTEIKIMFKDKLLPTKSITQETFFDPQTRMVKVKAKIVGQDLQPGTFVKVLLIKKKVVISVPETAVGYNSAGAYVYKFIDGKPEKTKVDVGAQGQGKIVIKRGLKAADTIVSVGQFKIYPNAKIILR